MKRKSLLILCLLLTVSVGIGFTAVWEQSKADFLTYEADLQRQKIELFWKGKDDKTLRSFKTLNSKLGTDGRKAHFIMNGGMYTKERDPQGLYIENGITLSPLETNSGKGNFYLMPNGIFYITKAGKALVSRTGEFVDKGNIQFATQSGPMLVINGDIHPAFKDGSKNLNIRNGIGILPDGKVLMAMSKKEINFYDFAKFFQEKGCKNALYLDGFVSRAYYPSENWTHQDGNFGVMIAVLD